MESRQFFKALGHTDTRISSPDDADLLPIKTALNNGEVLRFTSTINRWKYSTITKNDDAPENEKYTGGDKTYIPLSNNTGTFYEVTELK